MPLYDALRRCSRIVEAIDRQLEGGKHLVVLVPRAGESTREREKICAVCSTRIGALDVLVRMAVDSEHMADHRRGRWAYVIRPA